MCLSKKILYQYFVVLYPPWNSFSSENILYVLTWHYMENVREKASKCSVKTTEIILDAQGHMLT